MAAARIRNRARQSATVTDRRYREEPIGAREDWAGAAPAVELVSGLAVAAGSLAYLGTLVFGEVSQRAKFIVTLR
jgi:hypothetical protein